MQRRSSSTVRGEGLGCAHRIDDRVPAGREVSVTCLRQSDKLFGCELDHSLLLGGGATRLRVGGRRAAEEGDADKGHNATLQHVREASACAKKDGG